MTRRRSTRNPAATLRRAKATLSGGRRTVGGTYTRSAAGWASARNRLRKASRTSGGYSKWV